MQITNTPPQIPRAELDGLDGGGVQPTTFTPALPKNDGTASDAANQTHCREGQPSHDSPTIPGSSLDPTNIINGGSPIVDMCELGSMYYDASFDLVHFDVMGFNGSPLDVSPGFMHMAERDEENRQPGESPLTPYSPRSMEGTGFASNNHTTRQGEPPAVDNARCIETLIHDIVDQTSENEGHASWSHTQSENVILTNTKRDEILHLLVDTRPVSRDGTLVDGNIPLLSLDSMQEYLDLFLRYFNTSYPMVHVATLQISSADPMFVLSMIILGATYKNKDSHQLSVTLYDAVVPYILSGLISIPLPDLSTLQAFLILECYGVYRAGPYQRENAMLIHTLLFSAIRRVSRYHVRGGIMLPNHLACHNGRWKAFAQAEQYKRLILFVFMWDTQNVSCYSVMPNMSTQTIQVPLPCAQEVWEATTEAAWEQAHASHAEPANFHDSVKSLVEERSSHHRDPMDRLSLTLLLHGLMSMCNDIAHFDNRSIYLGDMDHGEVSWTPWRRRMTHALETWKARYDAYAMASAQQRDGRTAPNHREEDIALLTLYHTAHIVINSDIRHLQAAAGAKGIFGHIVMPEDRQESANWVKQWVRGQAAAADHAAWHAAQMLREGILHLKNWDVYGVFHYPWCLVIATLTCWAFHAFGSAPEERTQCAHGNALYTDQRESQEAMNHMVSLMASVSPGNIRRTLRRCCIHGLTIEVARYLQGVRWTAAFEAMKLLDKLSRDT
ncbi:hypothetical protein HFD88_008307 [Aspergillus terreus]|nr:hypothetical protein HFD88_008307 [Aspergillus terreus]